MPERIDEDVDRAARLRALMDTDEVRDYVRGWPPITDEQRARLAQLVLDPKDRA